MEYWRRHGIADEAAAIACAAESNGVHYSFEKADAYKAAVKAAS